MNALAIAVLAIVTQNQVPLRASPQDTAPQQAVLWQGDVVELRAERGDYVQVYDHRRERAGYVRLSQVRATSLEPENAPSLLAVVRFLRDAPGEEALGISYAAAYLKAVPPADLTAEPLDAIGTMAERLAQRASTRESKASEAATAAQLEVVAQQGVVMKSFDRNGSMQICYDGDMYRRVLVMPSADAAQRARAALGLTKHECLDSELGPTARMDLDLWRAEVLEHASFTGLSPSMKNRLHMRRAGVYAAVAFWKSRRYESGLAAAGASLDDLAAVSKSDLQDEDWMAYDDAAIRVGASRLAAEPPISRSRKLIVQTQPGTAGETCVALFDAKREGHEPLARRCTFGIVWIASVSANAEGSALVLAVQPMATWRELWIFRRRETGWTIDVLPPGDEDPGLGYIEFAGWQPGSEHLLVVRELMSEGRFHRRFELVRLDTLLTDRQAGTPQLIPGFRRWQDAVWRSTTIALR